jgi:hypothetical protein
MDKRVRRAAAQRRRRTPEGRPRRGEREARIIPPSPPFGSTELGGLPNCTFANEAGIRILDIDKRVRRAAAQRRRRTPEGRPRRGERVVRIIPPSPMPPLFNSRVAVARESCARLCVRTPHPVRH